MMRMIIQVEENPAGMKTLGAFLLEDQEVETLMVTEMEEMVEMTIERRKSLGKIKQEIPVAMMKNQEEDGRMTAL